MYGRLAVHGSCLYQPRAFSRACGSVNTVARRYAVKADYETKYAGKLSQLAAEKGLSVKELREKAQQQQEEESRRRREQREAVLAAQNKTQQVSSDKPTSSPGPAHVHDKLRKDSSPVKPLSSILNISRVLSTPHTSDQVTQLWNAYHMSRSGGTGRGYLCAAIPLELYQKMAAVAERYPTFVVPIRRPKNAETMSVEGGKESSYEFYLLQWDFHDAPPVPAANEDPFVISPSSENPNPRISTVLFTSLEEYRLRSTFATPYLVLTNYTDLAHTHGLVLLRGEITPGSGTSGNYMLSQEDAQQLSVAIQRFYLWGNGESEGEGLLKVFHEKPEDFKWQDLLKVTEWGI